MSKHSQLYELHDSPLAEGIAADSGELLILGPDGEWHEVPACLFVATEPAGQD